MASNRRSLLKGLTLGGAGAAMPGALASLAASAPALAQGTDGGAASRAWLALAQKMIEWDAKFSTPPFAGITSNERGEAPTAPAVRRYLAEFLHDRRVVQLSRWLWYPLRRLLILPLRGPKAAAKYAKIWMARWIELMMAGFT